MSKIIFAIFLFFEKKVGKKSVNSRIKGWKIVG